MGNKTKVRVALELSHELISAIDGLKDQIGVRKRGEVVEHLLNDMFFGDTDEKGCN